MKLQRRSRRRKPQRSAFSYTFLLSPAMRIAPHRFVRWFLSGLTCFGLLASVTSAIAEDKPADDKSKPAEKKITYTDHIQAIFREHCYTCHSQDTAKSDLALDSYSA